MALFEGVHREDGQPDTVLPLQVDADGKLAAADAVLAPAATAQAITPNDTTDLPTALRALYVGTGGDLSVILVEDTDPVTFRHVPDGTFLPVQVKRVRATDTTAADLVGLG